MSFASLPTPVSPEFGVAVRVALDGNELFHAGGPTFVQRALLVARGPALVATTVDVGHGIGAALDVGAVQEGAAVVADLLCSVQYQVGFSIVGPEEKRKINGRCQPPLLQCCKPHRSGAASPLLVPRFFSVSTRCISNCKRRCVANGFFNRAFARLLLATVATTKCAPTKIC